MNKEQVYKKLEKKFKNKEFVEVRVPDFIWGFYGSNNEVYLNHKFGYVIENTKRGTSIIQVILEKYEAKLVKKFKKGWFRSVIKVIRLPYIMGVNYKMEVNSTDTKRAERPNLKEIDKRGEEMWNKIKKLMKDGWD